MLVTLIKIFPFNMNEYSAEGICFNKSRDLTSNIQISYGQNNTGNRPIRL